MENWRDPLPLNKENTSNLQVALPWHSERSPSAKPCEASLEVPAPIWLNGEKFELSREALGFSV